MVNVIMTISSRHCWKRESKIMMKSSCMAIQHLHTYSKHQWIWYIYSCCILRLKGPGDFDVIANCITATNNCYQCLNSVGKVNTCFMPRQLSIFDFKQKCNMLLHNILSIITSELFFHMKVCLKSKACPGLDYPGNALSNKTRIINT